MQTVSPDSITLLPDTDCIRHAIDKADERARLLRRLLRAAERLRLHLATAGQLPTASLPAKGVARG